LQRRTEAPEARGGVGRRPRRNRAIENLCAVAGRPDLAAELARTLTLEEARSELFRRQVEAEGPEIQTRLFPGAPSRDLAPDPALLREFAAYRAEELEHLELERGRRLNCQCRTCFAESGSSSRGGGPIEDDSERTRRTLAAQIAYDSLVDAGRFGTSWDARMWLSVQAGRLRRAIRRGRLDDVLRVSGTLELEEASRLVDDVLSTLVDGVPRAPLPRSAGALDEAEGHYRAMRQAFSDRVPGLELDDPAVVRVADVRHALGGVPAWWLVGLVAESTGETLRRRDLGAVPSASDIERRAMEQFLRENQVAYAALERLEIPPDEEAKQSMRQELAALGEHARCALAIANQRRSPPKRSRGRPLDRGFNHAVYETTELVRQRKGSPKAYDWVATTLALIYHGWGPYLAGLNRKQQRKRVRDAHTRELERRAAAEPARIKRS